MALLRGILGRRLVRLGRYAEARPWFEEPAQQQLDAYVSALKAAERRGASKAERCAAYWDAACLMMDHGSQLANYFDPVLAAERGSGRKVNTGEYPEFYLKYGERDSFVPPLAKAEQHRLSANDQPVLRRHYSTYLAADLGWKSAALMPDNEAATALRLNTAGSWLKNGDDQAADRFYQAIERRCARTELGQAAIKRHWFVPSEPEQ